MQIKKNNTLFFLFKLTAHVVTPDPEQLVPAGHGVQAVAPEEEYCTKIKL